VFDRILVPLDGSPLAETILFEARRLYAHVGSEILLFRAAVPPPTETAPLVTSDLEESARVYLERIRDRLESLGVPSRIVLRIGMSAEAILGAAREEAVSLVAMATHGRTGLARLLMGSVCERVIRSSPVPVLAVRPFWSYDVVEDPDPRTRPIKAILVPLDPTGYSTEVLDAVSPVAREFGATIVLLHAIPEGKPGQTSPSSGDLASAESTLGKQGIPTVLLEETGPPARRIVEVCREHQVDLIAMATHGRKGLPRLREGSVTESVLRHAQVPLLVLNPSQTRPRQGVREGDGEETPDSGPQRLPTRPAQGPGH
jgi:nucleotide-binding universal stress UspA family protein